MDSLTLFTRELSSALRARGVSEEQINRRIDELRNNAKLTQSNGPLSSLAEELRASKDALGQAAVDESENTSWRERMSRRKS